MKEANPILEMSYSFALDVTAAAKAVRERKEYDLASQFSGAQAPASVRMSKRLKPRKVGRISSPRWASPRKRPAKPSTGSGWPETQPFLTPRAPKNC